MKTITLNRIKELNRVKQTPQRAPAKRAQKPKAPAIALKHLLVPVDFSAHSLHALDFAEKLAKESGGTLTLLHVVEPIPGWEDAPALVSTSQLAREAEQKLQRLPSERHIDPRLIGRTVVKVGTPWYEITQTAKDLGRDLIVIATHGYTGWKHVLIGSTAERVVRHASCPVLVVR